MPSSVSNERKVKNCFSQVCDEPHPLLVKSMLEHCVNANIDEAYKVLQSTFNNSRHKYSHMALNE
jgi:hypothetical protein